MPTLNAADKVDRITPKSVLRYRPIGAESTQNGQRSVITAAATPTVKRASRPRPATADVEVAEWQRIEADEAAEEQSHTTQIPPRRASATMPVRALPRPPISKKEEAARGQHLRFRPHPLVYLGLGMVAMLALWIILTSVIGWINVTLDDIHYGRPRTFQIDAVVSHNDTYTPSHFIAINLNRHIEIIEIPGGDATHARVYLGPQLYGTGDELAPVTLSFEDVNKDKLPDMLIHFKGSVVVLINDQGGFRPLHPEERQSVEQFLQQHGQ